MIAFVHFTIPSRNLFDWSNLYRLRLFSKRTQSRANPVWKNEPNFQLLAGTFLAKYMLLDQLPSTPFPFQKGTLENRLQQTPPKDNWRVSLTHKIFPIHETHCGKFVVSSTYGHR